MVASPFFPGHHEFGANDTLTAWFHLEKSPLVPSWTHGVALEPTCPVWPTNWNLHEYGPLTSVDKETNTKSGDEVKKAFESVEMNSMPAVHSHRRM